MSKFTNLFSAAINFFGGGFFGKLIVFVALCLLLPFIQKLLRAATKNTVVRGAFGIFGCATWAAFFSAAGFPLIAAFFMFLTVVSVILMAFGAISKSLAAA